MPDLGANAVEGASHDVTVQASGELGLCRRSQRVQYDGTVASQEPEVVLRDDDRRVEGPPRSLRYLMGDVDAVRVLGDRGRYGSVPDLDGFREHRVQGFLDVAAQEHPAMPGRGSLPTLQRGDRTASVGEAA